MSIQIGDYSYNETDKIGQGAQGSVYKGFNIITKEPVAIKIISTEEGENEVDGLRKLYEDGKTSPYVIKYYGEFISGRRQIIVTEFVEGLQLDSFTNFERCKNPLNFWRLIYQLLKGVEFIHSKGLAHGDILNVNILLTNEDTIKYVDFGRSCVRECPQVNTNCKNVCNTLVFVDNHGKSEVLETSLAEHQQKDLTAVISIVKKLFNSKKKYFKFIAKTSLSNNSCDLKEVIEDTKTEAFLKEVVKGTYQKSGPKNFFRSIFGSDFIYEYDTVGKILALFNAMVLKTPFEDRLITITDLIQPIPKIEVELGDFIFFKRDILSTQRDDYNVPYSIIYSGLNRKNGTKVLIKYMYFLGKDDIGYDNAMKEIDVYEKLYENGTTSRYVAKYYGSYLTETGLYIVTEFINGTTLYDLKEELANPLFIWSIMYQLLLGLKFIHSKDVIGISLRDKIILDKDLIKYVYFEGSCLTECPRSNAKCTNLCNRYTTVKNDCFHLYLTLNYIFNRLEKSSEAQYVSRTKSFLEKIEVLVKDKEEGNLIEQILNVFRKEILTPYLGKKLTIEEDYADVSELEFNIDSIIAKLNGAETKGERLEKLLFSDDFSLLQNYYDQIRDMAIDENKLMTFNITLKNSLLQNKQEQFRNFPKRHIFINFYALFTKMLQASLEE